MTWRCRKQPSYSVNVSISKLGLSMFGVVFASMGWCTQSWGAVCRYGLVYPGLGCQLYVWAEHALYAVCRYGLVYPDLGWVIWSWVGDLEVQEAPFILSQSVNLETACCLQVWAGVPRFGVGHLEEQGVPSRVHCLPCELLGL